MTREGPVVATMAAAMGSGEAAKTVVAAATILTAAMSD